MREIGASHEIGARPPVSQFLRERFIQLSGEIEARAAIEIDAASAAAGYRSRREAHEELNQIVRRVRACHSTEEVADWLVDSTSSFAGRAALFEANSTTLRGVRSRGFAAESEAFEQLEIPLEGAPALAHCVRERDTVVAIGSPSEVSPELAAALVHRLDEKVYLYPIVIENETVAVLYATADGAAGRQFVDGAALELLTQAAALAARILSTAPAARVTRGASELVNIGGLLAKKSGAAGQAALQQAREARARWQARAAVAGLRVRQREGVERGRAERDIYGTLKPEIDAARRAYQHDFVAVSPAIADYLHKELLKLAHDDPSLLGPDYPGSMS